MQRLFGAGVLGRGVFGGQGRRKGRGGRCARMCRLCRRVGGCRMMQWGDCRLFCMCGGWMVGLWSNRSVGGRSALVSAH